MPLRRRQNLMDIVSSADAAYHELCRLRERAGQHPALRALELDVQRFEDATDDLERKHGRAHLESFREELEQENSASGGGPEWVEEALLWCDLEESKDELAEAYVIILQGRLSKLYQAARRVHTAAQADGITLPRGYENRLPKPYDQLCWHLANFIKHRDEWPHSFEELVEPEQVKPSSRARLRALRFSLSSCLALPCEPLRVVREGELRASSAGWIGK